MQRNSITRYSSTHADTVRAMARVHNAPLMQTGRISAPTCPDKSVEEHALGEFPMTCYRCHVHADS